MEFTIHLQILAIVLVTGMVMGAVANNMSRKAAMGEANTTKSVCDSSCAKGAWLKCKAGGSV